MRSLVNELLDQEFIIKTVTRTENTNDTRTDDRHLEYLTGISHETKPKLVFGPAGSAVTVWQTTYSIKAMNLAKFAREFTGTLERYPNSDDLTIQLVRDLIEVYKSIFGEAAEDLTKTRTLEDLTKEERQFYRSNRPTAQQINAAQGNTYPATYNISIPKSCRCSDKAIKPE